MKTIPPHLLLLTSLFVAVAATSTFAQRELAKKKGPTSKIYIAEASGDTQVEVEGRIYTTSQASAYDAPGTIIETMANSHNIVVYSNGTGMLLEEKTRVRIEKFVQDPVHIDPASKLDSRTQPAVSNMEIAIQQGNVGICPSAFVSGSSMLYTTPVGTVNVRGGKLAIMATDTMMVVDIILGDATVHAGAKDVGGTILRAGERATVQAAIAGDEPVVMIAPIPSSSMIQVSARVDAACTARKAVTFELIERAANEPAGDEGPQEIIPRPTVPEIPPTNIVVSPDRLSGT